MRKRELLCNDQIEGFFITCSFYRFEVVLHGGPDEPGKIYFTAHCRSPCASELEGTTTMNVRTDNL